MVNLCSYGCGRKAIYQFKNGKYCCELTQNKCPIIRKKNSENSKGKPSRMLGKKLSEETKNKISKKLKGRIVSNETKKKISEFQSGKIVSEETRKKLSLSRAGKYKGKENPNWKGGYFTKGIPTYDNFSDKLVEECRRNKKDKNILEVRCSFNGCRKWFVPKLWDVYHRIESINDIKGMGEGRLYCSEKCKKKCSIFGLNYDPFEKKEDRDSYYTDNEYKNFRQFVLERDNYICQFCGNKAKNVHHEKPKKLEPFFSLDPDYAWSCCEKCHYEKGHKDECSTGNLAKNFCKGK